MHGNPGLHRRPGGVQAARIAVRARLRPAVGKATGLCVRGSWRQAVCRGMGRFQADLTFALARRRLVVTGDVIAW